MGTSLNADAIRWHGEKGKVTVYYVNAFHLTKFDRLQILGFSTLLMSDEAANDRRRTINNYIIAQMYRVNQKKVSLLIVAITLSNANPF